VFPRRFHHRGTDAANRCSVLADVLDHVRHLHRPRDRHDPRRADDARESRVRPHIERGELVAVLEEYCTPFPGMYLYYPRRRQAPPALRVYIDYLRQPP
jgi:hypothetical protein